MLRSLLRWFAQHLSILSPDDFVNPTHRNNKLLKRRIEIFKWVKSPEMTLPPYDDWSAAGTITCQLKIKVNDDTTIKQNC